VRVSFVRVEFSQAVIDTNASRGVHCGRRALSLSVWCFVCLLWRTVEAASREFRHESTQLWPFRLAQHTSTGQLWH